MKLFSPFISFNARIVTALITEKAPDAQINPPEHTIEFAKTTMIEKLIPLRLNGLLGGVIGFTSQTGII